MTHLEIPEQKYRMKSLKKHIRYDSGRLYFSDKVERRLFFLMTIVMLFWGVLIKIGLL